MYYKIKNDKNIVITPVRCTVCVVVFAQSGILEDGYWLEIIPFDKDLFLNLEMYS